MPESKPIFPWQIIEELRVKSDLSKKLLADKLQINYNYLVDLLNGRYPGKIDNDKLRILSEIFRMSVNDLIELLHQEDEAGLGSAGTGLPLFPVTSGQVNTPLRDKVPAGYTPRTPGVSDPNAFAVQIKDNSLFPPCQQDSIFVISPSKEPRLGDIVLVTLKDYRVWLLELNQIDKNIVTMRFYNANYKPIMLKMPDIVSAYPAVALLLK